MTQARKLKKIIRARAAETGESYAAARRHVVAARSATKPAPAPPPEQPVPAAPELAPRPPRRMPRPQVSNAATLKATGRGLDHWFAVLDAFGTTHGHTKTVNHLYVDHEVPAWHGQMITVKIGRAHV